MKKYYVVKKNNVVEEARSIFDYMVKKLGLEEVVQLFLYIVKTLLQQVKSYAQFDSMAKFLNKKLEAFILLMNSFLIGV